MGDIFSTIGSKLTDEFQAIKSGVSSLFSPQVGTDLQNACTNAYADAVAAGPLPNQLSGPGATLAQSAQSYLGQWQASDSLTSPQTVSSQIENGVKNVAGFSFTTALKTLVNPSVVFSAGVEAIAVLADVGAAVTPGLEEFTPVLTPLADWAGKNLLKTFGTVYTEEFLADGGKDLANTYLSPTTQKYVNDAIDNFQVGIDFAQMGVELFDPQEALKAPAFFKALYNGSQVSVDAAGWISDLEAIQKDMYRSSDPLTSDITSMALMCSAVEFQCKEIAQEALTISAQRSLTSDEQGVLSRLFSSPSVAGFLNLSPTDMQRLLQAVGPLNQYVSVQNGQALILGTDQNDTIDVFSSVDVTGDLQITVNNAPMVVVPRSAVPDGVAIYARGGDDHVSIRSDVPSVISGGTGNDTLIGGWGPDVINGGPGNDTITGRDGDDLLSGGPGDDDIDGGSGNNVISGGTGTNHVVDNHHLVPFSQVIGTQKFAPAPASTIPILVNVSASSDNVPANGQVTISAIGADGNGGALLRFEVWIFGAGGQLLGVDETANDGFSVTFDASLLGGPGTHKIIAHVYGTNGVASNWVAHDIVVSSATPQIPVITTLNRTPNPLVQGQTLTLEADLSDPSSSANFVQFVWDRDGSGTVTTGDTILGNGSALAGGKSTFSLVVTTAYATGVQHFLARARYANNTQWTDTVEGPVEIDPPANSGPTVVSLSTSSSLVVRGFTVKLTADGVGGPRPIREVRFYRDSNGNGVLDSNGGANDDQFLGSDTDGTNGYSLSVGTSAFPLGQVLFFVQPEDSVVGKGNYASASITLTLPDHQDPTATLIPPPDVNVGGGTQYAFQVVYFDDVAIDMNSLNDINVRVTGPNGNYSQLATFVSVDQPTNGSPRTATYQVPAPGGIWDSTDNGSYQIGTEFEKVFDTSANFVPPETLGSFNVSIADSTPPSVALNSLSTNVNQPNRQTGSDFGVTGSASDADSGILATAYHFFISTYASGTWSTPVDQGAGGPSITLHALADGLYAITLQATNNAGLTSLSLPGYFSVDTSPPSAAISSAPILTQAGAVSYDFQVTYTDNLGIDVSSLQSSSVSVVPPGGSGTSLPVSFVSIDDSSNGSPRIVTYRLSAPSGSWTASDNGSYTVHIGAGNVHDTTGNPIAAATLGNFTFAIPTTNIITVINTNDSGTGSLRDAIATANSNPGADTITFNIPGSGVHTIALNSPLPDITDAVTLDATSQPGYSGAPLVELNGAAAGSSADGLRITASNSSVQGFVINRFQQSGIVVHGASHVVIAGNYIGTSADGSAASGDDFGVKIESAASFVRVGTDGAGLNDSIEGNLISGNRSDGVLITGGSFNNVIAGNMIGTNVTGSFALGNNFGIKVEMASYSNRIGTDGQSQDDAGERNIVSGNRLGGITVTDAGSNANTIAGNWVGLNANGTATVDNAETGIWIRGGAQSNIVGTNGDGVGDADERNVVAGNDYDGIAVEDPGTEFNAVAGNYVGTDASGNIGLGGNHFGVLFNGGAQFNRIGTNSDGQSDALERNILAGNLWDGVGIFQAGTSFNIVAGNYIGVGTNGVTALGNNFGVRIDAGASNNRIGTDANGVRDAAETNIIAGNRDDGVLVEQGAGNSIRGNRIFNNGAGWLEIDLGGDGPTANDVGDTDMGANNLQNYPVLTVVASTANATTIRGTLNSTVSTQFYLEFLASSTTSLSDEITLGNTIVGTDGSGNAAFDVTLPVAIPTGYHVWSTATNIATQDTSEFSAQTTVLADVAPQITSLPSTIFSIGVAGSFQVTTSGVPAPTLSEGNADILPAGVTFHSDTGVLSGTPASGSDGIYTLHFTAHNGSGDASQTFMLTVSPFGVNGSTITVLGTSGNDTFSIEDGVTTFKVTLNSTSATYDNTAITQVIFNGNGGSDTASLLIMQGASSATIGAMQAMVSGPGYNWQVNGTNKINVFGSSADTATLNDTSGNDQLFGLPSYSILQNQGGNPTTYYDEVVGFGTVNAISTSGTDYAYLYDSSGADTYTSDSTGAKMTGNGYAVHDARFKASFGFFVFGGTDTANVGPNATTTNYVFGNSASTANFFDGAGNDIFFAVPAFGYSIMLGGNYYNEVANFGTVFANSENGGNDQAVFYDTPGNDTFDATGNHSSITGGAITNQANDFAMNTMQFEFGGTDTANLSPGTKRTNNVFGAAGDTVNFFSSSSDDNFDGDVNNTGGSSKPYSLLLYGGGYSSEAIGFGKVNATASNKNGNAYLYDSPSDDTLTIGGSTATLTVPGIVVKVQGYANVLATRSKGNDTQHVTAHDFVYQQIGGWTDV